MKRQNGMGHVTLIICIVFIILAIVSVVNFVKIKIEEGKEKDIETDMLLLQGKVKVMSQEATIQKNEEILKGKKLSENLENEEVKKLVEKNIISTEDNNFEKYYLIDKSNLEEIGLGNIELQTGIYVVNYNTYEIIYSRGIVVSDNIYYKLTELQTISNQNDEKENEIVESNIEDIKKDVEESNVQVQEENI